MATKITTYLQPGQMMRPDANTTIVTTPAPAANVAKISLKTDKVTKVYSGRDGACCCGCAGKHYQRGDKSFPHMLSRVARMVAAAEPHTVDCGGTYVAVTVGARVLIAYFD